MMEIEDYETKIDMLNEELERVREENYTLREELKGDYNYHKRYAAIHNRLDGFGDEDFFIPVSHIWDRDCRKNIIEVQTDSDDMNIKISELICNLLNLEYF